MSDSQISLANLPAKLSAKSVLGFDNPGEGEWARMRGMQYSRLNGMLPVQLTGYAVAAVLMCWLHVAVAPSWMVAMWVAAIGMLLLYNIKVERSLADTDRRRMTRSEARHHAVSIAGVAFVWSIPLAWSAYYGALVPLLLSVGILATLIAGAALVVAATPIGVLVFAAVTGSAGVVAAIYMGQPIAAAILALYLATVCAGTVRTAKVYLNGRIADAAIAEKSEVVSLLLREFEENKADWLWQVDTNRRIRSVSPRFSYALGRQPEDVEGKSFLELVAGDA